MMPISRLYGILIITLSSALLPSCPEKKSDNLWLLALLGGRGTPTGDTATPTITYPAPAYSFVQNTAITAQTPTVTATPLTECISNPALPAGLSIDPATCAISGTPTAVQAATAYTITATNAYGSGTANISITVTATGSAPTVGYTGSPYTFTQNVQITPITATLGGSTPTGCSSATALPAGLSINATSCAISGTPTAVQGAKAYTITATNAYGSGTANLSIAVTSGGTAPTVAYSGSPYSFTQNTAITTITPTLTGNTPTSCNASSTLPAGLSINASTCAISGTPTAVQAATFYTITATNAFGSGTATINITVADITAPTVVSSTPANGVGSVAPCTGSPCAARVTVVFSETMNTSLTQTLTTEIWDGTAYNSVTNAGSTFAWSTTTVANDTLTITPSWVHFPENSNQIRWTLAVSGLQDAAGNPIAAQVQRGFTTTTRAITYAVADTGIAACYNDSTSQLCNNAGWLGQDGDYADVPNARSFTGPTPHGTYTSDYTTTDNVTTLVWKSCSEGLSGSTCATGTATGMTWYPALNACAGLNAANSGAGYAGRTQWRLPTKQELQTIPNYGTGGPAIDGASFPATMSARYSTSSDTGFITAWYVHFSDGSAATPLKTTSGYVRCVATGP